MLSLDCQAVGQSSGKARLWAAHLSLSGLLFLVHLGEAHLLTPHRLLRLCTGVIDSQKQFDTELIAFCVCDVEHRIHPYIIHLS